MRAGLVPVGVDCDPATWNMTVEGVEAAITPRTRAIMLVHIYGLPVDLEPILALARKHDLKVIEDAAEMHGQTYRGAPCGSFGDVSTFSFYPNKHVTTGEGGMILTDDDALADRLQGLSQSLLPAAAAFRPRGARLERAHDQPPGRARRRPGRAPAAHGRAQAPDRPAL